MVTNLRVSWAFLVRDFRMDVSYKLGFLVRVCSGILIVAIYYFIANIFGDTAAPYLKAYGGSFFALRRASMRSIATRWARDNQIHAATVASSGSFFMPH